MCTCLIFAALSNCYYFHDERPSYLTAGVGDTVVFNCEVDFPQDFPIPYKFYWKHKVIFNCILMNTRSKLCNVVKEIV